ncbi:hypothetical protein [Gryllotalpicola sp.]|uniref:hypothetical protein n=1 Tax=Gryllotalpicola sp. TaxID=1932787 RepID=UPI0026058D24|nr:hypothetical protein [Gryllotalpicola sp.]
MTVVESFHTQTSLAEASAAPAPVAAPSAPPIHDDGPMPAAAGPYLDRLGSVWILMPDGGWCYAATGVLYSKRRRADVTRNAPFTPLYTLQAAAAAIAAEADREHAASGRYSNLIADDSAVLRRLAAGRAIDELI